MTAGSAPRPSLEFDFATPADAPTLAQMNEQLIADEGHSNRMNLAELTERMRGWLTGQDYTAVLFRESPAQPSTQPAQPCGYALYRSESALVYLRQFFVARAARRRGIGRAALAWLRSNAWSGVPAVRLDVLVGNAAGIAFWQQTGFEPYCLSMQLKPSHPEPTHPKSTHPDPA